MKLIAAEDGLLKIDTQRLQAINSLGEMMIATRHSNFPVRKGDKVAGTRIIPLIIAKEKMDQAVALAGDQPLMDILPYTHKKSRCGLPPATKYFMDGFRIPSALLSLKN